MFKLIFHKMLLFEKTCFKVAKSHIFLFCFGSKLQTSPLNIFSFRWIVLRGVIWHFVFGDFSISEKFSFSIYIKICPICISIRYVFRFWSAWNSTIRGLLVRNSAQSKARKHLLSTRFCVPRLWIAGYTLLGICLFEALKQLNVSNEEKDPIDL